MTLYKLSDNECIKWEIDLSGCILNGFYYNSVYFLNSQQYGLGYVYV